ncbi:MAG: S8 family serine peptidase [Candidatus Neomarinimicrobiota bacterium]
MRILPALLFSLGILVARETTPGNVIPGKVIFKLAPGTALLKARGTATAVPEVDAVLSRYSVQFVEPLFPASRSRPPDLPDISRIYLAAYETNANPYAVAQRLQESPQVIYAEPVFIRRVYGVPDDSLYSSQWHLSAIMAADAWDISHGDSTIIIAVVDNGFDMDHPDLEANYFTNPNEIPGNQVDDDGNGYVDDVQGWDFGESDNDPTHGSEEAAGYWVHGTHVAGIANAVTDNQAGVAGVAWNVKTLPIKAAYDDTPEFISFGYSGIVYAAELGAHVINCSWGGTGYSLVGAEVIEYATGFGSLIVGSAGNENANEFHYPSAYQEVLSVASVSSSDRKSSFSNYGLSVDVSAPGETILSTTPESGYGHIGGTSMSSPLVAGLAALVKSYYPDLTAKELAVRVAGTVEGIDNLNPQYEGLIGTGRINAFQALDYEESEFVSFPPKIVLVTSAVTDVVGGNGDGVLDRGETVYISTTYRNYSLGTTQSYTVTLTTDDPALTVVDDVTSPRSFPPDARDTIENGLSFSVSDTVTPRLTSVVLNVTAEGEFHASDTLTVTLGRMPVLMVDDDFESCCGDVHVDGFYRGILDENNLLYGIWDHSKQGSPSGEALLGFPMIIWFTEWDFPSLDSLDRAALSYYLDNGGNLYISGQDLGWDLADPAPGFENEYNFSNGNSRLFYETYLHATWGGDDAGSENVEGIWGDPISSGLDFNVWQPGIETDSQFPDWFTPDDQAVLIFQYDNGKGMGLRYDGDYRLVYTGMGLEAFGSDYGSVAPEDINDTQRTVLTRILSYLNFIHHDPLSDTESTETDFDIAVEVTGEISDLEKVALFYKTDDMTDYSSSDMEGSDGQFTGTIPAPNEATTVRYYVETDHPYYTWTNPVGVPENVFQFYAGPDTVPPQFVFVSELENRIDRSGTDEVTAFATDNIGIGEAVLTYTLSTDRNDTLYAPMAFDGSLWRGEISWSAVSGHTVITYQVVVKDVSSNENEARSEPLSFKIVNQSKVGYWDEEDISQWDTGDGWGLFHFNQTIRYVMDDSPGENYSNNANNVLAKLEPLDVSPYESAYLSFLELSFMEEDKDFGYVELSRDGNEWTTASSITGVAVVRTELVDLTPYIDNGEVWLRLRMTSDEQNTYIGWYVDDIHLLVDTTLGVTGVTSSEILPSEVALGQNYPNPFNAVTAISFSLPYSSDVQLAVYDLLGREVASLVHGLKEAGRHEVLWNAHGFASGIYVYRLETSRSVKTRKLLLLK